MLGGNADLLADGSGVRRGNCGETRRDLRLMEHCDQCWNWKARPHHCCQMHGEKMVRRIRGRRQRRKKTVGGAVVAVFGDGEED
jgi:hypothetical protein